MFDIKEELKKLPEKPGVYLMKNASDDIIYVGKAKVLKNRVKSYFMNNNQHNEKTIELVSHIRSFEYIVTENEVEALILECNLIKKHMPKYNIRLKNSSGYPYIKINIFENYPRVYVTHEYKKDHNKYFGPYIDSRAVYEVMDLIQRIWQPRTCNRVFPRDINKDRACLNYHIKKCNAPCQNMISMEDYDKNIKDILAFLNGDNREIIEKLKNEMIKYSDNMQYEKAQEMRDKILSIQKLSEKQKMDTDDNDDLDIIGLATESGTAIVQIFFKRKGKMLGREQFTIPDTDGMTRAEIITEFVKQFYKDTTFVPKEILVERELVDPSVNEWLNLLRGSNVNVKVPQKGDKLKLLKMAQENASLTLIQFGENMVKEHKRTVGALAELQLALGFSEPIKRIEAYDISNVQGFESVGSMIVFENGLPRREDYRKFKIKTVDGPDDYASMNEVIQRRFKRYIDENSNDGIKNKKFNILPDVLFIDGGKGQVNAVMNALMDVNIDVNVVGMIKDDKHRTRGMIYNGKEIIIPKTSEGFKLLTRIQDEVHRFALEYHKKLRKKRVTHSILDEINGVGVNRRNNLLKSFDSIDDIKSASIDKLMEVDGINKKVAEDIYYYFNNKQVE